jgi:hypothetical protein
MMHKTLFRVALLIPVVLFSSGCGLGDIISLSCEFMSEPDHCYQAAAVQDANPEECAKITGQGFVGQNPPRDKCYLMIAENTGDYEVCKEIQGGLTSYTPEECVTNIAVKNVDPEGCKNLTGPAMEACTESVTKSITSDTLTEINDKVEKAKAEAGADPSNTDAQEKLKKLLAQQAALFENASEPTKVAFMKSSREAILADVEDEDVKAEIVKLTLAARGQMPGMSLNDQLAKLKEIREQQELTKRLDEQANTLMDQIKSTATDFAKEQVSDAASAKAKEFIEARASDELKSGIARLEGLKEKYDKASEQYQAVSAQIEKLQKVYHEVNEVKGKIAEVDKMVGEGKIDPNRAKVLHGAIYLGKALEYATDYVPVFGSTASTISKEVMDATVKFATSRAARTTALDKCIDDPEHCDPTGITPY